MSDLSRELLEAMSGAPDNVTRNPRNGVTAPLSGVTNTPPVTPPHVTAEAPVTPLEPEVTRVTPVTPPDAEGQDNAAKLVASLRALRSMTPLPAFSADRWRIALDSSERIISEGWADKALRFGWLPVDLFGVHPQAPAARYDFMGIAFLMDSEDRITFLSEGRAEIMRTNGATRTFRRVLSSPGSVLPWRVDGGAK